MWNENMELTTRTLPAQKTYRAGGSRIYRKDMLMKWVARHQALLAQHIFVALPALPVISSPGLPAWRLMPC